MPHPHFVSVAVFLAWLLLAAVTITGTAIIAIGMFEDLAGIIHSEINWSWRKKRP